MFTVGGKLETTFKPIPGRVHPKEGNFVHQGGEVIKDRDGRIIGRHGGQIKKRQSSTLSGRSKNAKASGAPMAQRFCDVNKDVDYRVDNPVELSHQPVRCGGRKAKGGRSGGLARALRG